METCQMLRLPMWSCVLCVADRQLVDGYCRINKGGARAWMSLICSLRYVFCHSSTGNNVRPLGGVERQQRLLQQAPTPLTTRGCPC